MTGDDPNNIVPFPKMERRSPTATSYFNEALHTIFQFSNAPHEDLPIIEYARIIHTLLSFGEKYRDKILVLLPLLSTQLTHRYAVRFESVDQSYSDRYRALRIVDVLSDMQEVRALVRALESSSFKTHEAVKNNCALLSAWLSDTQTTLVNEIGGPSILTAPPSNDNGILPSLAQLLILNSELNKPHSQMNTKNISLAFDSLFGLEMNRATSEDDEDTARIFVISFPFALAFLSESNNPAHMRLFFERVLERIPEDILLAHFVGRKIARHCASVHLHSPSPALLLQQLSAVVKQKIDQYTKYSERSIDISSGFLHKKQVSFDALYHLFDELALFLKTSIHTARQSTLPLLDEVIGEFSVGKFLAEYDATHHTTHPSDGIKTNKESSALPFAGLRSLAYLTNAHPSSANEKTNHAYKLSRLFSEWLIEISNRLDFQTHSFPESALWGLAVIAREGGVDEAQNAHDLLGAVRHSILERAGGVPEPHSLLASEYELLSLISIYIDGSAQDTTHYTALLMHAGKTFPPQSAEIGRAVDAFKQAMNDPLKNDIAAADFIALLAEYAHNEPD